jgi:SagB-type dehydrogenase family enzyme
VALEADAAGQVVARLNGYWLSLGGFGRSVAENLHELRPGVPLAAFASGQRNIRQLGPLARRLAKHGLLEFCLKAARSHEDQVVIEPQTADYWPGAARLDNADVVVLSRFAYMRRRGNEMVLESPRARALFKICDPQIAAAIAALSTPQLVKGLRRDGFKSTELLGLLADCQIIIKIDPRDNSGLRQVEGDESLVFWDFHDLLFHSRSTEGRQANPLGGVYPHLGFAPPLPAVRPAWPGKKISLRDCSAADADEVSPLTKLLRERHSTRAFDDERPITIAELARFLENTARVLSKGTADIDGGQAVGYTVRPYPCAGASYELELYLAVDKCDGLARGFYHYDADEHALVLVSVDSAEFEALLTGSRFAMDAPALPQILITIAARFGRMSWKYSSLAYALILKDVGVLTQTFYLMATQMGLGGCAIGTTNIDLFAKITGIEFHVEGPVGQFALGRGSASPACS